MDRFFYPLYCDGWDIKLFCEFVRKEIQPEYSVLDFGAGRGAAEWSDNRDYCKYIAGVDVDPIVLRNPYLNEARVVDIKDEIIPFSDNTFDIVYALNVIEHLPYPEKSFSEIWRVLKPGGKFLAKTPNKFHYVAVIASLTPYWFHKYFNKLRGRDEIDTFPTTYLCNKESSIRKFAEKVGFDINRIDLIEGRPEYLRISALTYPLGILYERIMNSSNLFSKFRVVIQMEMQKRDR